jgi:predicted metal-dependent enzyme (double-stranded beta helix superfamily)
MCDFHHPPDRLAPLDEDEYVLDTPTVRRFIGAVEREIGARASREDAIAAIEPMFVELLRDPNWLPARYQEDAPDSGMGGGIGQWLLYRSADRSLSLFSLVVPPGAKTPVHDHLAWGLVGLYRGNQDEEFYAPRDGRLESLRRRPLEPGDWYALLPPEGDVHRVRTTSDVTSVSIHLLASDAGCTLRHVYDDATGAASDFRSGYVNAECPEGAAVGGPDCA